MVWELEPATNVHKPPIVQPPFNTANQYFRNEVPLIAAQQKKKEKTEANVEKSF